MKREVDGVTLPALVQALAAAMARHEVHGLPIVPADDQAMENESSMVGRGRGLKRARGPQRQRPQSAAGSGGVGRPGDLAGLPYVEGHGRRVSFVHRGSHEGGEGIVPPALQMAFSNMSEVLSQSLCVDTALKFLRGRRRDRHVVVARFLAMLWPDARQSHVSSVHSVISHLCGVKRRTVQCTLTAMRKRGFQAARARGPGGRPRRSEQPGGRCRDASAEGSGPRDLETSLPEVPEVAQFGEALAPVNHSPNVEGDVRTIGLRLGALVACLGSISDQFVVLFWIQVQSISVRAPPRSCDLWCPGAYMWIQHCRHRLIRRWFHFWMRSHRGQWESSTIARRFSMHLDSAWSHMCSFAQVWSIGRSFQR